MTNNYLFRGISKDTGEWVYGYVVGENYIVPEPGLILERIYEMVRFDTIEIIPETVGQWIGLEDKNGVKIFSDDLVKYNTAEFGKYFIDTIKYDTEQRGYELGDNFCGYDIFDGRIENREVIGSIHTTPELLDKEE